MKRVSFILIAVLPYISLNVSALTFSKFIQDPAQNENAKRYNSQTKKIQTLLAALYKGHLEKYDIELLKTTLKSDKVLELNHWYFSDKLTDKEDRKMPYWSLRDIRKLAAYAPLFFTKMMDEDDKFHILAQLYHSDLIQRKDFGKIARLLSIHIDPCLTHNWGNTDSAITSTILNMIDFPGINDDKKFAIIQAVRDLTHDEQYPGWVLTTLVDELPMFYRGLGEGHGNILITLLETTKTHQKKQTFIIALAKEIKPESSFFQRLKFIKIRTNKSQRTLSS